MQQTEILRPRLVLKCSHLKYTSPTHWNNQYKLPLQIHLVLQADHPFACTTKQKCIQEHTTYKPHLHHKPVHLRGSTWTQWLCLNTSENVSPSNPKVYTDHHPAWRSRNARCRGEGPAYKETSPRSNACSTGSSDRWRYWALWTDSAETDLAHKWTPHPPPQPLTCRAYRECTEMRTFTLLFSVI